MNQDLKKHLQHSLKTVNHIGKNGKYIADIEEFQVIRYENFYSLWDRDELCGFTSLTNNVVDDVWINPTYRGKKLFSKLLWFYKSRLGHNQLLLGKVHSRMMQEVVKGLSCFKKSWVNVKTKANEPFDLETLDHFYGDVEPTDWRLMLENNGDFSDWPMFRNGSSFIAEDYTEIIE